MASNAPVTKTSLSGESIFEQIACPLCQNRKFKTVYEESYPAGLSTDDFLKLYSSSSDAKLMERLVECRECGLAFLNPRLKREIVLRSYSEAVDPAFVSQNETRIATFRRALGAILEAAKIKPSRSVRVLDIGCAGGAFPKAVVDSGMTAVGVEPSRWLCDYGKRTYGLDLLPGTLDDQAFPAKSFDLITLWDVIEHVHDPVALLRKCRGLLKDDGVLVLNYPDYGSPVTKLLGRRWPFFLSVHLFYFTPATIKSALNLAGLHEFRFRMHWQTLTLAYVLQRAGNYLPFLPLPAKWIGTSPLAGLPVTYYLGQTTVFARANGIHSAAG